MKEKEDWIALLGQRDSPTDALRDYCSHLGRALERQGVRLEQVEVPWVERGWWSALTQLSRDSRSWQRKWVLLQYTALSWSRRGFPFGALAVVWLLKRRGARCVIVFHDSNAYPGIRLVDKIRQSCQRWVMRRAYRLANYCIFTIPLEGIPWLPANSENATFIPIGANIPGRRRSGESKPQAPNSSKTVAVFTLTGGQKIVREVQDIAYAVKKARERVAHLRLLVLGRHSDDAESALRKALQGTDVEVSLFGLLPEEKISHIMCDADASLFVRGHLSGRRGSALASIACGLPIVGYAGPETGFPVTEAGVELVPEGDREALADALGRVLSDECLRQNLCQRSLQAQERYFSWEKIAERYEIVLGNG
jgi:glycosyltransferase involved in cell wall biosynthesis